MSLVAILTSYLECEPTQSGNAFYQHCFQFVCQIDTMEFVQVGAIAIDSIVSKGVILDLLVLFFI